LIFSVVDPVPANQMSGIAAGFVFTRPVPDADVIGDIHAAPQYPPQAVNAYMGTVECIEPMPPVKERTPPQLAPVLLNIEVAEEFASIGGISKPQFAVFDCRRHGGIQTALVSAYPRAFLAST